MKAQKPWLRVLERLSIVQSDVVFSTLVAADGDALLRESRVLLDVPDFQDPVCIKRINAATPLVADHVDNVVMFEWWLSAQIYALQLLSRRDVVLLQHIRVVQEHYLS